jgi:phosphatidylserine/phosphatidylglycerophosphate/cardiolipin synthase-like enzyme
LIACLLGLSAEDAAAREQGSAFGPAEWANVVLEGCRSAAAQTRAADESLDRKLASGPQSREESSFLVREAAARASLGAADRRATFGRLNALLFGSTARLHDRESVREDTFVDVLKSLLGREDVCALEAIESTVVFALFGLPYDADTARHVGPDRQFRIIGARVRRYQAEGNSPARVFEHMRPVPPDATVPYIEAVTREALAISSRSSGSNGDIRGNVERRLAQFLEFIQYAAEPVRIQSYLHARVDELEGALGTALSDGADEALFRRVEEAMYPSVEQMRQLRGTQPADLLVRVDPIVERWFHSTALPAVTQSLRARPFAAYWFFVQSGGVVAPGPAFSRSRVQVLHPAFALADLRKMPMSAAVAHLATARVPAAFLEQHAALETAFTELTLSRDELLARLDRTAMPTATAAKLRDFLLADGAPTRVSSIDVYRRLVRDASRIPGRVEPAVVAAAIDVICEAKSERLESEIGRILALQPGPAPQLAEYLRTAAALMVELERRQAAESAFQQSTAGAAIGWLLSQFFIAGTVPIALWAPQGVTGEEFVELIDDVAPKNRKSGNDYHGKPATGIDLVHDGGEYYEALVTMIDSAAQFLNISAFDWKTDNGGRDIAYRLMAKKLGIDGAAYLRFLAAFERGIAISPSAADVVGFYDIPTTRMKDLLVTWFILTSDHPDIVRARAALRDAGATLACSTVMTCGDLQALREVTGARYDRRRRSPESDRAWVAYQQLDALFAEHPPDLDRVRPRGALREYCEDADALRRFVRRVGLQRADRPGELFPINIVADSKQNFSNLRWGERSQQFPYFVTEPMRDIYFMLLEFDIRVVLWKGPMEFPWRIGPVPVPGRKIFGVVPMPFIPWPWLNAIPGFQWTGWCGSLLLQYLLATDVRIWWASLTHTKSWSSEAMALESGLGMATKYYNRHDEHLTWHDMGVLVRGAPVGDVNDHFVEVFNEARVNNTGLPAARGVRIPKLRYEDYRSTTPVTAAAGTPRTWLLTTHPEQGESNYRGIYMAALAAARRNIYIETPFFSDPLIARMLIHKAREFRGRVNCEGLQSHECAARMRDAVQIYLVVPDASDKPIVDAVGVADFHQLLHLGIKIYRWRPEAGWSATSMLHSKVWLIDHEPGRGGLAYVGAANATQRSHLADNEAGLLSSDPGFVDQVYARVFVPDITTDSRLESGESFHVVWSSRPIVRASRWLRRLLVDLFWVM